ncbi:major facilitator superfamily domain-containing protein [Lophiotrema nucula]|uniref:Major facilitator superfamily domain-containing protein n=1 Tax=Lophiotrema nucula TaxID=690887 RepID=A0A6A5ZEG0_9PLEO|nr:major facilitator superfamily domain-containing protein [Lophiotrema nucula]
MAVVEYLHGRSKTLKPTLDPATNPIRLWTSLSLRQWMYFLVGVFAWTWDAFDFHSVTLTYPDLSRTFNKSTKEISVGVTLVLMCRPLGAAIFGLAADRYGRKWPFIVNNFLLIFFELGTGFCQTYSQFLAVRALFGFAMGGIYGNAAATALEDCPEAARGLMSGIFQNGYPLGYLLATVFWKAFDENTPHGWRALFWFGAGPPIVLILARLVMAETDTFQGRIPLRGARPGVKDSLEEIKLALARHWGVLLYLVLLMTGFTFLSHGTQDLYPLMLRNKYDFNSTQITLVQVTANLGGCLGGAVVGYGSQIFGRRFSIIISCILGAALLYPYTFVSGPGLYAAAFFEQFCVQGAWGVIPIHLIELSPVAFRTLVVGTSYQLGNLVSAASNSIETAIGERYPLPERDGEKIYDYSLVICIFTACVFFYTILITSVGPEKRGTALSSDDDDAEELERDTASDTWDMHHSGPMIRY